jgi:hypothetical protein
MDPSTLYSQTLSQLGAIELSMTSPAGDALIQAAAPADHQKAIQTLLDVHEARLALGNASLQAIADKLKANEAALVAGTKAVQASLNALNNLAQILNTVSTLVGIVAQIVTLIK